MCHDEKPKGILVAQSFVRMMGSTNYSQSLFGALVCIRNACSFVFWLELSSRTLTWYSSHDYHWKNFAQKSGSPIQRSTHKAATTPSNRTAPVCFMRKPPSAFMAFMPSIKSKPSSFLSLRGINQKRSGLRMVSATLVAAYVSSLSTNNYDLLRPLHNITYILFDSRLCFI